MDRVLVKAGTKTNMYNLFEDLQDYSEAGLHDVLHELFATAGVNGKTTLAQAMATTETALRVSGVVGQSYVTVLEGAALTDNMDYMYVAPGTTVSLSTLANGTHTLYLSYSVYYSDPVDVMSGFAYAQAGVSQQNSRSHGTHLFVWDADPITSGIALATVDVANGLYLRSSDLRATNVLKLSESVIPHNVMKIDAGYTQTLTAGLTMPSIILSDTSVALLTLISGAVSEYLSVARLKDLLERVHTQETDTGTTSTYFRVGNTTTTSNDGDLVMTQPETPMAPKNVRIEDIYSPTLSSVRWKHFDAELSDEVRTGLISHEASVSLKWNYDDIQGEGGKGTAGATDSGKFRITNSGGAKTWAANELVGYHLFIPSTSKDYAISANLATTGTETVLTIGAYGHSTLADGVAVSGAWPCLIHSNCDSYEVIVTPVLDTGELVTTERYEDQVTLQESPPVMQDTMNLFLGEKVVAKVRAVSGTVASAYTEMAAGSFTKQPPFSTIQYYDKPFLVKLPLLDSTGAKVGANTTGNGFTITIVGWEAATDFEVCYTTDAAGPDFLNETHEKITTRQRSIDVVASGSRVYYIAVRPLMAGQAVAVAKTCQVTSGSAGSTPKDSAYPITNITFKTYSGTLSTYNSAVEGWGFTTIYSPSGTTKVNTIDSSMIGSMITISGIDYSISDVCGQSVSIVDSTGNSVTTGLTSLTYSINTSKAARQLAVIDTWPIDAQLTAIMVEQWSKGSRGDGGPVLRWYQSSMESYADSLPLTEKGMANYTQSTDTTILAQNGNRNLIIDLWDPSLSDNVSGFMGNITVYWKPYVATGRRTDNTKTPTDAVVD